VTRAALEPVVLRHHLPRVAEALGKHGGGTHTVSDLLREVAAGEAQLWQNEDAILVTQVVEEPRRKVLHFWVAAGDLDACVEMSRRVMEWGRSVGCDYATLTGRKGWLRALADEGWSYEFTVMGRPI
jgi:hypothetical protein